MTVGLAASKGEAARLIKQGGLYVNDQRVTEERGRLTLDHAIDGRVIVLRKGQRERRIVQGRGLIWLMPSGGLTAGRAAP